MLGETDGIAATSRDLATVLPQTHPHRAIYGYWAGELSEASLLQGAGTSRVALCNYRFGAGLWALGRGDRDAAASHFREAVAARTPIRTEYHWSRAFLARLRADPDWPSTLRRPVSPGPGR